MKNYSKEKLIKIALEQEEKIAKIRGYHSGITEKMLQTFDTATLISCINKNAKNFNLPNPLNKLS